MGLSRKLLVVLLSGACCTFAMPALADPNIQGVGDLPGGTLSGAPRAVSANGLVVVGQSNSTGGLEGYRWENGTIVGLGDLAGGVFQSNARATNANGAIVVGDSRSANGLEAFRWENGVLTGLGDLPGGAFSSTAIAISENGLVIVGNSNGANGLEAFRWENGVMTGIGDLPGGTFGSTANAVNASGSIIAGHGTSANGQEAFRWENGIITGLGDLAGGAFISSARGISADGQIIVGWGSSASGTEAARWENGIITGLGDLAGGAFNSQAYAANADGSVVVGYGTTAIGTEAFRWTAATNMERLADVLAAAGVDITGWILSNAQGIDSTGNVIVGGGTFNGDSIGYIANLSTGGVTTPEELAAGLVAATVPAQQAQGALTTHTSQSLFATANAISSMSAVPKSYGISQSSMGNITPAAGGGADYHWSGYTVGSFGIGHNNDTDNWDGSGTTGVILQAGNELALGAGIIGGTSRSDLPFEGESRLNVQGASVLAAYEARNGLRFYGTGFVADLDGEIERHYGNGAGIDGSKAKTNGIGYGGAARAGWEFAMTPDTRVMPYGEIEYTKTKTDAYAETGGAFPASYSEQKGEQMTTRLGAQIEYDLKPDATIGARAAWAHRVRDENSGLSVSTTGFTGTLGGGEGDKDWAEGAVFTSFALSPTASFGAELSGRTNDTKEPQAALTLGVTFKF